MRSRLTPVGKESAVLPGGDTVKRKFGGGDIFDLTTKDLQQDSMLYDCASLTAFPAEQRPEYIRHFYERMPERSQIVLVTTETADQAVADSVTAVDSEVRDLYEPYYSIELIYGGHRIKQDPTNPLSSHSEMEEKMYLMKSG